MQLRVTASLQVKGGFLYLLEMDQEASPWSGVFVYRLTQYSYSNTIPYASLAQLLTDLNNPISYHAASIVFQEQPPADQPARKELLNHLNQLNRQLAPPVEPKYPNTLVTWLPTKTSNGLAAAAPAVENFFVGQLGVNSHGHGQLEVANTTPLNFAGVGADKATLALNMPAQRLKFAAQNDQLVLIGDAAPVLASNMGTRQTPTLNIESFPVDAVQAYVAIPMTGPDSGTVTFSGKTTKNFKDLNIGFEVVEAAGAHAVVHNYPLLAGSEQFADIAFKASLAPLALANETRSNFQFSQPQSFVSAYVSLLGTALSLKSVADTTFLRFYKSADTYLYLAPHGSFDAVPFDEPDGPYANKLLCGLSGTEYLQAQNNAQLHQIEFVSNQPAVVTRQGDGAFASTMASDYVMSWTVPKGDSTAVNYWYGTEPVAYFAGTGSGDEIVVDYYPLNRAQVLGTQTDGSFPLLPYGDKPTLHTQQVDNLSALEAQAVARTRQTAVAQYGKPSSLIESAGQPAQGYAVNDVGFQAYFDAGDWRSIQLAQAPDGSFLGMKVTDGSFPNPAISSLLAGQQFLVISLNKNFGQFELLLKMAGWEFGFAPPDAQTVGAYENVLIIKAGLGKVEDLVRDPLAWTEYADFNDASSDPHGNYLSNWLVGYCEEAIKAKADGVTAFNNFVDTIQNPDWTGVLALNVSIGLGDLDPALEPLLAGINLSKFRAHHVGNEATRVQPPASSGKAFDLQSALFALVHYVDPSYAANSNLPKFQSASGSDFDFKVLKLTASFLKSGIASFDCQLQLQANSLFGAKVINVPASKLGQATNWVLISGSVQKHDGIPVYTFASPAGTRSLFFLAGGGISHVVVSKVEFAVVSTSGSTSDADGKLIKSAFRIWGGIACPQGPTLNLGQSETQTQMQSQSSTEYFDFLSYEQLPVSGLEIDMRFNLKGNSESGYTALNKSLGFNAARISVATAEPKIVAAGTEVSADEVAVREGSLLSQYPMKVLRLFSADHPPDAEGYGSLNCPPLVASGLSTTVSKGWYGFEFAVQLGSMGALAPNVVLTADLLFAWTPQQPGYFIGMKLPGMGPLTELVDIEGVIKFGAQEVSFSRVDVSVPSDQVTATAPAQQRSAEASSDLTSVAESGGESAYITKPLYVLNFASIGLRVLGFSFPAAGSTNLAVFGNPYAKAPETLGWFGSYVRPGLYKADQQSEAELLDKEADANRLGKQSTRKLTR